VARTGLAPVPVRRAAGRGSPGPGERGILGRPATICKSGCRKLQPAAAERGRL